MVIRSNISLILMGFSCTFSLIFTDHFFSQHHEGPDAFLTQAHFSFFLHNSKYEKLFNTFFSYNNKLLFDLSEFRLTGLKNS
jgi:hypothetical protein